MKVEDPTKKKKKKRKSKFYIVMDNILIEKHFLSIFLLALLHSPITKSLGSSSGNIVYLIKTN